MYERTFWTFWFYKSANKRFGISLTNRGPKLEFQTYSQQTSEEGSVDPEQPE